MKVVNVPGAGAISFPDSESDESIYSKIAQLQERLQKVDLETRPDPRDIPFSRVASNAFNRMGRGLGITALNEAPALASSLFGADDTARELLEEGKAKRQALEEKYPASQRSFEGIRGLSDFGKFVVESGVEAIPAVGAMATTGGIGSLAARGLAKGAVEAAAARAAASRGLTGEAAEAYATRLGNRLAPAARSKAGDTGLNVGIGAGGFGLNAPESFAGIYEETDKLEPGLAIGAGAFKSLFDSFLPARLMTQLGARGQAKLAEEIASRSTIVPESFKLRLAKEIGKTAAAESITEPIQEATDIIAEQLAGAPGGLSDPKNVDRLLMAAAKGGIGGAAIGTPGALVQTMRETPAKEPELPLNETKLAGSVGPGLAENLAAAMQKRKAQEAITEDEFQLLVQNGVLKDNPQTRASVKFAAPSTDPSLEEQTNAATTREAVQNDEVANAALAQAALQQAQQQNQQNDQVRQDALAQAQAANEQRQAREVAAYQAKQRAASEAAMAQREIETQDRAAATQQAQQNVQPNVQSESTPLPNVTPPSGASTGVPSGPGAGVPPGGVATSAPSRVAPAEQPSQQAGVGEGTQPPAIAEGKRAFEQALQAFNQTKSPEAFANLTQVYEGFVQQFGVNDAYVMGQYAHAQDKMPRPAPVRPKDEGEYEPGTPRQRWNEDDYTPKDAPAFDDLSEKLQNTWAQNPPSIELANQIVRAHRQETAGRQVLEPVTPGQRVKLDTPEKEWNEQYRQYEFEPEWKKLKPELKVLWKNAHKQNSLSQNLFNHIVDIQVPAIARSQQELLGLPYKIYAPRETGIPSDRAAIVAEKKANSTFKGYFTMPRVVDNLINLAHDIVFGAESIARPKLGLTKEQREEESSLETKNEPKKDTKHYNRTSAADLKKLDEWVRSTLTKDAVTEYDRQLDIQRKDLAKIQSKDLETKALAKTAAAEAGTAPPPAAPVVKVKPPKAAPPPKAPPKPKRQQSLEQLANKRARETEGQETELDKDVQTVQKRQTETERLADKARAHAAEVDKENQLLMQKRQEELARRNARPAQYAEGVEYKPLSDKFPISREDFARALGITTHNRAWLATDFNAELAAAVTRGDMPAVIKALLASKNPIIRDIAQRAQATQRFIPSERIKVKIDDEKLRQIDLDEDRQPGSLAGIFDGGSNTVFVNSVYAGSEHTIAHEIVHGLTERIIKTPHPGNQLEGVNRLKRLYKDVLAKAKSVYKTDNLKELPYGFRSESEFLAEGLSNPEFQYLLAALPHEGKTSSMWTEFVRAIAQILGLKDHSALTELLDIYSVMLEQGPIKSNQTASGAVTAALIGAPPPPNNNYPLVPDDLPENAKVPPSVATPPAALPQVAVNRAMVGPMQQILSAPANSEVYINATDAVGRSALSLQPMWYIADTARKLGFGQIGEIENSLRKAGAMKNTMLKRSSDFMTKALAIAKADPAGKKAMDAFVNRASGLAIDVTRSKTPTPEFVKARGEEAAIDYLSLRAEYDKLKPKFQTLASDLVAQYRQFRDEYFEALKKSVHDQYQDDPVKADKILSGLDEKYKKFNEAYTPFVRIGDYWITYVNPDTGKDVAESYTSLGAQKTRLEELKKAKIVYVQSFKQTDFRKFSYKSGPVNQFFDEIKGNVVKALPIYKDDSPATADRIREAREEMMERLYQASLLLHPESSMLRQFGLERKGTLGYIEDTLAAYDHKAPVYATQISQVANKGEIEHQIDSARKQNASNPDTKMSDIITHVAKVVYGVDTVRSDDPLNQIANNVNRLGFTFYMGFNPASALVNMLQTPTVMFPLLAGEFHGLGQSKIMSTLFSAMTKVIGSSVGQQTYGERLVESAEAKIDAAVAKGKTREEAIAALPEMERVFLSFRDQGILNAGDPSHDFGSVAKYGSGEASAFGKGVRAFTKYSAIMFQRAEAINREAGALATYQLMKQRLSGKSDMSSQEKYAEAIRKATDMVTRAHGDYQHGLAPKIFLSPTMRVIFMFKKFPAHMAALYVRLFKDMFSDVDPEVRKVARIQFAGLMGMSSLFAGTMGMPFYFIVRDMMNLMLDDEDDPYDFDFAFYNYLSDMWGQPMANRITRGWLGDLGGDVASKVGYASSPLLGGTKQLPFIGGLLGLRDGKNTASAEDDLKNYVAEAAGASAGMALQIARGVDKLAQGDVYRFLEGVTPMAGMRNIAKSIRLSKEGALTTRGEPIIEDVSLTETALQAVGFTPQRLAGQYQLNAWQKDMEKQILDRRQGLINQKFNARARGDYEVESDVNDEISKFNMLNPEKGLRITSETLAASARTRAQQSKDTKAGIYLSKPFRQRFADIPVYAEE